MRPIALLALSFFPLLAPRAHGQDSQEGKPKDAPPVEPSSEVPSWPLWPGEGAPVRGTGENVESTRWTFALRAIPEIDADRAKLRTTLMYRFSTDFQAGIELNPIAPDVGPIANWRVIDETSERPALIFGTSSDRIGTPHGRAIYGTFSKDLEEWTGIPIAPYAGASFGTFDDELVPVGGLVVRWADRFSTSHLYDGHNLHHIASYALTDRSSIGLILAEQEGEYFLGMSFSTGFGN